MSLRAPVALSFPIGAKNPVRIGNVGSYITPTQLPFRAVLAACYALSLHRLSWPLLFGEIGIRSGLRPHLRIVCRLAHRNKHKF